MEAMREMDINLGKECSTHIKSLKNEQATCICMQNDVFKTCNFV